MATSFKKKIFLLIFCLASITQGMYSTYFVSILTTIERIYQIQSKTAGAILSATEIGQILGSLFIAYYGGRGNKPRWISVCMTLSALAALISISPHFILPMANTNTNTNTNDDINHQQQQQLQLQLQRAPITTTSPTSPGVGPYLTSDLNGSGSGGGSSSTAGSIITSSSSRSSSNGTTASVNGTLSAEDEGRLGELAAHPPPLLLASAGGADQLCRRHRRPSAGNYPALSGAGESIGESTATGADHGRPSTGNLDISGREHKQQQQQQQARFPVALVISIFAVCLLAIGFGSTAITTLGIPLIDDIIAREESPFYLGLTIGLRIFGPALGFLLGSFCIQLDASSLLGGGGNVAASAAAAAVAASGKLAGEGQPLLRLPGSDHHASELGAWWLGLVIISLPLLVLAVPMYFLSRFIPDGPRRCQGDGFADEEDSRQGDDYAEITYQAAEDHDIGGSRDFPVAQILAVGCRPPGAGGGSGDLDSESLHMAGGDGGRLCSTNYGHNIASYEPLPMLLCRGACLDNKTATAAEAGGDQANVCRLVVNHLEELESTSLVVACQQQQPQELHNQRPPSSTRSSSVVSGSSSSSFVVDENNKLRRSTVAHNTRQQTKQQQQLTHTSNSNNNKEQQQQQRQQSTIGDLSSSLWRLLRNRLLVLRMLSGVLHILPIAGFYTFLPKYLMEQFRLSSSSASAISGLAGILFVGFGAFLGGTIIRLFNVNSRLMTRWIACSALLYACGMLLLMNLDCGPSNQIVHFNSRQFVSTDCSRACQCAPGAPFNPVCHHGRTYASPCLAGCRSRRSAGALTYAECGCTPLDAPLEPRAPATDNSTNNYILQAAHQHHNHQLQPTSATQGPCASNCDNIIWYVILFSIFTLVHASCEVGSMMFNLRCVKSDDRTLALGLITFSSSLLGTIPCSIIYGSVVDFTCVHWDTYQAAPGGVAMRGACRAYDNDSFRHYLHGLTAAVMALAFLVDCVICSRSSEVDFYEGADESKMDIRQGLKKSTETIQ